MFKLLYVQDHQQKEKYYQIVIHVYKETLNTPEDNDNLYSSYIYTFDNILENADSQTIYNITTAACIDRFVNYINSVILAYGVTSSGKTYTINEILSIALDHILQQKEEDAELSMSFFQIYNEQIYDLIDPENQKLQIKQSIDGQIIIPQLSTYRVQTKTDMLQMLAIGNEYRATAETTLNQASSRSHSILTFYLKTNSNYSKLSFIDLAGSEKFHSKNSQQVVNEAKYINKSLTTLGNVMQQLVQHQKNGLTYINFRDSKLTRFLSDSVGGNCFLSVITTISPSNEQMYETLNSLKFADRAKQIQQHEQVNVIQPEEQEDDYDEIIKSLQEKVQNLEQQVKEKEQQLQIQSYIQQEEEPEFQYDESQDQYVDQLYDQINYIDEQRIKQINDLEQINQNKQQALKQKQILQQMNQKLQQLETQLQQLKIQNLNAVIPECTNLTVSQWMEQNFNNQLEFEEQPRQTPRSSLTQISQFYSESRDRSNNILSYQQKLQELSKIRGEQYNQQQQILKQQQEANDRINIKKGFLLHQMKEVIQQHKNDGYILNQLLQQYKQEAQQVKQILQNKIVNNQTASEQQLVNYIQRLVEALKSSDIRQQINVILNDFI